jgi:hypothetical protein
MQTSGASRREIAKLYQRHCERSEAIHLSTCGAIDCFAALAMTRKGRSVLNTSRSLPSGSPKPSPVAAYDGLLAASSAPMAII